MKRLRLRKWVKYSILSIFDLIFILNLPVILKDTGNINDYRFNILILFLFSVINTVAIITMIERD